MGPVRLRPCGRDGDATKGSPAEGRHEEVRYGNTSIRSQGRPLLAADLGEMKVFDRPDQGQGRARAGHVEKVGETVAQVNSPLLWFSLAGNASPSAYAVPVGGLTWNGRALGRCRLSRALGLLRHRGKGWLAPSVLEEHQRVDHECIPDEVDVLAGAAPSEPHRVIQARLIDSEPLRRA